jgi:hypothetical protein
MHKRVNLNCVLAVSARAHAAAGLAQVLTLLGTLTADPCHAELARNEAKKDAQQSVTCRVSEIETGLSHESIPRHSTVRAAAGLHPQTTFWARLLEPTARPGTCAHNVRLTGEIQQPASLTLKRTRLAAHEAAALSVGRAQRPDAAALESPCQVTVQIVRQWHVSF